MEVIAMLTNQHLGSMSLAAALCLGLSTGGIAASSNAHSRKLVAQAEVPTAPASPQDDAKPSGQAGMSEDIMDDDMMGSGMMSMDRSGMMGRGGGAWPRRAMGMMSISEGARLKIIFAIVDTNGDGALSFDEIMAVHKRVFDVIDANKDGKVTMEELQAFIRH
jgi:hypothetical protein